MSTGITSYPTRPSILGLIGFTVTWPLLGMSASSLFGMHPAPSGGTQSSLTTACVS